MKKKKKEKSNDVEEANPINLPQVSFLAEFLKKKKKLQPVSDFYMIIPLTDEGVSKWFLQLFLKLTIFFTRLCFCPINATFVPLENPLTLSYTLKRKRKNLVSFQALIIVVTELLLHSSFLN